MALAAERDRAALARAAELDREALALATELGMRPLAARCHLSLGETLAAAGEQTAGGEHRSRARELIAEIDLRVPGLPAR
jgi:hypothetical protein